MSGGWSDEREEREEGQAKECVWWWSTTTLAADNHPAVALRECAAVSLNCVEAEPA